MSSLPTVLTLQDTWVHVGTFDSSDESSNVEATIDNVCYESKLKEFKQ